MGLGSPGPVPPGPVPVFGPPTHRPSPAPPAPEDSLPGALSEEVLVWEVPQHLRMPGAPMATHHGHHASLADIFPGSGLDEAWDTDAALRTELRAALRADLFSPPPQWNEKQRRAATGLGAACMVSWRAATDDPDRSCNALDAAFDAHGVRLGGREFLLTLGGLCGEKSHGSLIDIVPLARRVSHSWHQVRRRTG